MTFDGETGYRGLQAESVFAWPGPRSQCCPKLNTGFDTLGLYTAEGGQFIDGAGDEADPWVISPAPPQVRAIFAGASPQDLFVDPDDRFLLIEREVGGVLNYNGGTSRWEWDTGPGIYLAGVHSPGAPDTRNFTFAGITYAGGLVAWTFSRTSGDYDPALDEFTYPDTEAYKSDVRPRINLNELFGTTSRPPWRARDAASGALTVTITRRVYTCVKGANGKYDAPADPPAVTVDTQTITPGIGDTQKAGEWIAGTAAEGTFVTLEFSAAPDWDCLGDS